MKMFFYFSRDAWPEWMGMWKYIFYFILCLAILFISQYFVTITGVAVAFGFFSNSFWTSTSQTAEQIRGVDNGRFEEFMLWMMLLVF